MNVTLHELQYQDKLTFVVAMQHSQKLHHPWVKAPTTDSEFDAFFQRSQLENQKNFIVRDLSENIVGVFNVSEIVRGLFQSAYLGFYAVSDYAGKGYMSAGLQLVLEKIFKELELHRIEANIQPENTNSIQLVRSNGFRYEGFSPRYLKINNEWRGHEHWAMTFEDYIRNDIEVLKQDNIALVAYDSSWPNSAQLEMDKLRTILPSTKIVDIQHVGSTAIPGVSAKPIIDIQIAVNSLDEMKIIAVPLLQKLQYEFWEENPDPKRMFFVKGMPPFGSKRTHHIHIFEANSDHWRNKIIFRDYLRLHPVVAQEYEKLKYQLAKEYVNDREKYTDAKLDFVNYVLQLVK